MYGCGVFVFALYLVVCCYVCVGYFGELAMFVLFMLLDCFGCCLLLLVGCWMFYFCLGLGMVCLGFGWVVICSVVWLCMICLVSYGVYGL